MPESKGGDEIDLLTLFLKAIRVIRANFWLFVVFVAAGAAVGFARFMVGKKEFENKMIVSSGILTDTYSTILFDNINRHLSEQNYSIVAKQLGTTENVVKPIRTLKIESLFKNGPNPSEEKDRFVITANVTDQKILPELQKGILYYLENNEYVKIRIGLNRKTATQMLASVEKEIADMEVMKTRIMSGEFFKAANGNVMFDPTSVNSKILELAERRLSYQTTLALSNSVYVIEGFTEFEEQSKPKLTVSVTLGITVGFFLALGIMIFNAIKKLLQVSDAELGKQ